MISDLIKFLYAFVFSISAFGTSIENDEIQLTPIITGFSPTEYCINNPTNITEQVEALNQIVADYCVPQICSEAQAYINYKNDVSNLAVPIQRPVSTYNNSVLELKKFF